MQKIRMGNEAKFRDKNKCFVYILFPVLRHIFTSGILHAQLLLEISIHSADTGILAMSYVDYTCTHGQKPFRASLRVTLQWTSIQFEEGSKHS